MGFANTIPNPSTTATMIATLHRTDGAVIEHRVPPREMLQVAGRINWGLWTLEWREPRRGLVRFRRAA